MRLWRFPAKKATSKNRPKHLIPILSRTELIPNWYGSTLYLHGIDPLSVLLWDRLKEPLVNGWIDHIPKLPLIPLIQSEASQKKQSRRFHNREFTKPGRQHQPEHVIIYASQNEASYNSQRCLKTIFFSLKTNIWKDWVLLRRPKSAVQSASNRVSRLWNWKGQLPKLSREGNSNRKQGIFWI